MNLEALYAPFPPSLVSWRVGSTNKDKTKGMALAYIDARDVMRRLDEVCGPGGWQARYPHANGKTICEIGIKVDGEWIWKANGAGDTDIEAEKGAISDAFKRAAVMWGVGRYLYDLPSPWVALNDYKQIQDSEYPRLQALLSKDAKATQAPKAAPEPPPAKQPEKPKPADSPALATLTAGLKACRTPDDVDEFANAPTNKAAMGVLSDAEFDEFQSRITRWKAHIGKVAA